MSSSFLLLLHIILGILDHPLHNYILYHDAWAGQRLPPVVQIIFNWLTIGCDTVIYVVISLSTN